MLNNDRKFLLIDGNYLMFSSFWASYNSNNLDLMKGPNGVTTNGIHVFLMTLIKMVEEIKPTHLFIAFDAHGKTKRKEEFEDYKAGRTKTPPEVHEQIAAMKEILTSLNIKWFEKVGDEADDLVATMAYNNLEGQNYVFSKDRDLLQLVNQNTCIVNRANKAKTTQAFDYTNLDNFNERYGIRPDQIADFKGLAGDPSDNLRGVPGIGDKGAIKLIQEFGSLENIYDQIDKIKGATQTKLIEGKEEGFFCKKLATLNYEVEMDRDINSYVFKPNIANGIDKLNEYGLNNSINKIAKSEAWNIK